MKYTVVPTKQFHRDLKRLQKRGYNMRLMTEVIKMLAAGAPLPDKYRAHRLNGNFQGCCECHVQPDWLLIYEYAEERLILYLTRTGTHSDLF